MATKEFRVVMVNPPLPSAQRFSEKFAALQEVESVTPPLGLCYLAAGLEKAGFHVELVDGLFHHSKDGWDFKRIVKEITAKRPDAVCVTATTLTIPIAGMLTREIKQASGAVTVLGGAHISVLPEDTMKEFPDVDVGVVGEGEDTIVELCEKLRDGKGISRVRGIVRRQGRRITINPKRPLIEDLDRIPFPARHLLPDLKRYRQTPASYKKVPHVTMITSRGCPYRCTFCSSNSVFGKSCRFHSAQYVLKEMGHLIENYGAREFIIYDDTFTQNHARLKEICEGIISRGWNIVWSCMGRANTVNEDMLRLMRRAGCWSISYGIESGDQSILNRIKKGITLDQVRDAVKWSKKLGYDVRGFFMIGHPGETKETIEKTIRFASSLGLDVAQFAITTPMPGTELWDTARDYGSFTYDSWMDFNTMKPLFVSEGLTEDYLITKTAEAFRRVHTRPSYILRRALSMRSWEDLKKNWQGMKMILKMK